MAKIEPFSDRFENMQALLARIAEDEEAIGFAGVVFRKDDSAVPVTFNLKRTEVAFSSVMLARASLDTDE